MSTVDSPAHRDAAAAVAAAAVTVLQRSLHRPAGARPGPGDRRGRPGPAGPWLTEALAGNGVSVVASGGSAVHLVGYGDGTGDLARGAAATVAMDTPYVLQSADSPVRVATYSSTQVAMEALAAVIAGKAGPPARRPWRSPGCPRRPAPPDGMP